MPLGIEQAVGLGRPEPQQHDGICTSLGFEIELLASEDGETHKAPSRIPLLPNKHHVKSRDGREFLIEDRDALIEAVRQGGIDLVVGRQHDEVPSFFRSGPPAEAAGWIDHKTGLKPKGKYGIVAEVQWTEVGRQYVESRGGRYISPVLDVPGMFEFLYMDGEVPKLEGILAASVVNIPALRMPSLNSQMPRRAAAPREAGDPPMNEEVRKRLCEALGLPLDAQDETIFAAAEGRPTKVAPIEAAAEAEIDLTQWVPREEFDALAKRLDEVEEVAQSSKVDQAIAKHRKRIASPAYEKALRKQLESGALSFAAFEEIMAATPESRLTREDEAAGKDDVDESTLGLTADELEFCKQFNRDPKEFAEIKARRIARRNLRAI